MNKKSNKKDFKFKYENDWQEFVKLQTSLNRVLQNPSNFCFTQENFAKLIESVKQVASMIQIIKLERKSYNSILQTNKSIQAKLQNHNSIISALQQSYSERIRSLTDEAKISKEQLQKSRKSLNERSEQLEKELQEIKDQNKSLRESITKLKDSIGQLSLDKKQLCQTIAQNTQQFDKIYKAKNNLKLPLPKNPVLTQILASCLNHRIVCYLAPKDMNSVTALNKLSRLAILHSPLCIREIFQNYQRINVKKINHFKKHIKHFQLTCQKIPQEMVKVAFYKHMILKKDVGEYMLPLLTNSAMLFQGKFQQQVNFSYQFDDSAQQQAEYADFEVDEDIKSMYFQELHQNKEMIRQQISALFSKIQYTAQLYSADVETIGVFLNNIQRSYSKLFVFAKLLYNEAKNLQRLNTYLLKLTSDRQQYEISKSSQIEDLKAELDSQRKIKTFFSTKSLHSQQRALALENEKLNIELKLKELNLKYTQLDKTHKAYRISSEQIMNKNQLLIRDNKILKQNFETINTRYNTVMQELEILKETLLKMNLG